MPRSKIKIRKRREPRPVGGCSFCKGKTEPNYKEIEMLARFVTDRGKIVSRDRSGICAKHQRQLAIAIKRARFLALLPYLSRVSH